MGKYIMESPVTRDSLPTTRQRRPRQIVLIPLEPVINDSFSTTRQRFYSKILGSRYFRHNLLLIGTNILAGIFAYLLHPFVSHMMSIQDYGQVAVLVSLVLLLATPTQTIATVAAKYASFLSSKEDYAQLNDFLRRLTVILLAVGVGITAIFVAISNYVAFFLRLNSPQAVIILALMFIVLFITPLNQGTLQGLQRFGWFSTITLLLSFLRLVLAIGFVLLGLGANGAILGIVVSTLLVCLISFMPLWEVLKGPRTPTGSLRSLWTYSILAMVVTVGIVALSSLDTVLAKHFLSASDAGLYAALATIGRTVLLITTGITTVMFPKVVELYERGVSQTRVVIQSMLGVFVLYGMAMLLLAVAQVLIIYFLAIGNRILVLILFLSCALQIVLIVWHHATIAQVVQAVIVTNAVLLLALLITFGLKILRTQASSGFRRNLSRFNWREKLEPSPRP